jgi:hypothetical protein
MAGKALHPSTNPTGASRDKWVELGPIRTLIKEAKKNTDENTDTRTILSGSSFLRPTVVPALAITQPAANI